MLLQLACGALLAVTESHTEAGWTGATKSKPLSTMHVAGSKSAPRGAGREQGSSAQGAEGRGQWCARQQPRPPALQPRPRPGRSRGAICAAAVRAARPNLSHPRVLFVLSDLAPHSVRGLTGGKCACGTGSAAHGCKNDRAGVCASARVCTATAPRHRPDSEVAAARVQLQLQHCARDLNVRVKR